jgi:phospho-N-acetylmuramoyl-pentapeptide-transferase
VLEALLHSGEQSWITTRGALAAVCAFTLALVLGPRVIRFLRRRKLGDPVAKQESARLDALMASKRDTPTMGGVFLVAAVIGALLVFGDLRQIVVWILVATLAGFGALGAVDDWMKWRRRPAGGLRMAPKFLIQAVMALAAGTALTLALIERDGPQATRIFVPFVGDVLDLGPWFPIFAMFTILACCNAVNITDGLDGLAGGCLAIAFMAYAVIAYVVGRSDFSAYLNVPYMRSSAELAVAATALLGATLGFLWFNAHPAQIFMGDSGSQPLGAALGLIALATRQELLLLLVGGVFVLEAFSSLSQIFCFKLTGRRIWRCAPIHHHFQFAGVPETRIVQRLWIVAAVLAVASLATLKLQ